MMNERRKLLDGERKSRHRPRRIHPNARRCLLAALLCAGTCILLISQYKPRYSKPPKSLAQFQACSIHSFLSTGLPFLASASPLPVSEFVSRRDKLAAALHRDSIDAFIAEPGFTFKYYANVSQTEWESWEPEERPFLMIVQPFENERGGVVEAKTRFLVPGFEEGRARLLGMPFEGALDLVPWEEHWDPYSTLRSSWVSPGSSKDDEMGGGGRRPKVMVDEEMRDFIQRGLSENGFEVVGLGGEVERVRQVKTEREIEILRAVNTGTVEAVRAMRRCLFEGVTEREVQSVLDETLRAAGLEPFFDIVLFDEDASNPHGGTDGSRVLEAETFVLIDVGAHLYGYSSDICRTFFPPFFYRPTTPSQLTALSPLIREKLAVWDLVLAAQTASIHALKPGNSAASVDIAARNVITDAGYGDAFTHRVGHGIGIKAHESPYLNKGNVNVTLRAGMTFTSEPGVYLVDKFGVRHEDILLVGGEGEPEVLTGRRASDPWDP